MATYVNDLRLKEISTGDESGTWGSSTNRNLELIAEGFARGTKDCFSSDADATETMADGSTDEIRKLYLKVTSSATLSATRTLTLAPNTVSKVWIIENATTGSQAINISQGSGANVQIPNGEVKVVATDGAGSGAAVYDLFTDLNVAGSFKVSSDLTVGGDLTVSGDDITLGTNTAGHLLVADGTNYNPVALSGDATLASNGAVTITGLDAAKIADGSVSSTEFQHLDGVTSAIQTQIDTKTTLAAVYPVGSVYINAAVSTNPATLLGFGTWVAFGTGRVLVGVDSGDTSFDALGETGGSKDAIIPSHTHTASVTDPGHNHTLTGREHAGASGNLNEFGDGQVQTEAFSNTSSIITNTTGITVSNSTVGESVTNKNLQPYITVYMWKRTA